MAQHPSSKVPLRHGGLELPALTVLSYNLELRDEDGFVGDRASQGAFRELVSDWRERLRRFGQDPFAGAPDEALDRRTMDRTLESGSDDAAALVDEAASAFADEVAAVLGRFLRTPEWRGVERIVVGGGLRQSRVGRLVIERADAVLRETDASAPGLVPLHHHADEGGLLGWVHLMPHASVAEGEAFMAVDIGGTNLRCGIVKPNRGAAPDLSAAAVLEGDKWSHAADEPERDHAVRCLAQMLLDLGEEAHAAGIALAPFVGISCPGLIAEDGRILRGAQNLPGDWEDPEFHLPERLAEMIPTIAGRPTRILLHNDAVVQGLSQLPFIGDVETWAAVTIGTGLGNASYRNRR